MDAQAVDLLMSDEAFLAEVAWIVSGEDALDAIADELAAAVSVQVSLSAA